MERLEIEALSISQNHLFQDLGAGIAGQGCLFLKAREIASVVFPSEGSSEPAGGQGPSMLSGESLSDMQIKATLKQSGLLAAAGSANAIPRLRK